MQEICKSFFLTTSYADLVTSDCVRITELRCPCCLNKLLAKYKHTEQIQIPMPEHG